MNKLKKFYLATVFAIAAMAVITGCGGGGGGSAAAPAARSGSVKLTFKLPGSQSRTAGREASVIPSATAKIAVMVAGDGLTEPEEQYITDFTADTVSVTFSALPVGEKYFTIYAMDSSGNLLAASMEIIEVLDRQTIQLHSELGIIILDGVGALPSTINLTAGDTLNVKNMRETQQYAMSVQGMDCPPTGMSFGANSQLACTFTQAGTYTVVASGSTLATVIVSAPATTAAIFKADASADSGYGMPPMAVSFSGRVADSAGTTSTSYTYSWDFGDGSSATTQSATHSYTAEGDYMAKFTASSGSKSNTDYVNIHVEELAEPIITAVSPLTGSNSSSTPITITGDNFLSGATVQIGGSEALDLVVVNATQITAAVPSGIAAGVYDVTVTNPDGQTVTLASAFTVTGTSAATYTLASYFPINVGDQRVYIDSDRVEGNGFSASERTETVSGPLTINSGSCYLLGDADGGGACFSIETGGLYLHRMIDTDSSSGATVTKTLTFNPPVRLAASSFSVGESYTTQSTATEASSAGQTNTEAVTVTFDVLAEESVAVLAGYFPTAVKARFALTGADGRVMETDYLWFAPGVGIIKDIYTDPTSSTCANGCPRVLKSATIASTTYPSSVSTSAFSGNYWSSFLGVGTDPMSGYASFAVSGSAVSGSGYYGTFTTASNTMTFSDTFTLYSNGVFKLAGAPTARGAASFDGSTMAFADPTNKVVEYMVRKGSAYSSSMIQGSYYGSEIHYSASGTVRVLFTTLDISGATGTYTEYSSSSTGTINQISTGTLSGMSLSADGILTSTTNENNHLYLVGENGDVMLKTRIVSGVRFLGVFVKKGSAMSLSNAAGPFMAVNVGYEMTTPTPGFFINGMALDITSSGTMNGIDIESDGTYHLSSNAISVSADGAIYSANDPYLMIGAAGNGNAAVGVDQNSLSIAFVIRAVNPSATTAVRTSGISRR